MVVLCDHADNASLGRECLHFAAKSPFIALATPHVQEVAVNRTELIGAISGDTGLTRQQSESALDSLVYEITKGVRAGVPIRITGFGTFKLRERRARSGRNPQTGAPVYIRASKGIGFTPGVQLKADLNSNAVLQRPTAAPVAKKAAPVRKAAPKKAAKKAGAKKVVKKAGAKKVVKKAPAKKVVKKAPAKKVVKKAPAKKRPAHKAPAKKAPARKAPAKKAPAHKVPAKRAPARKRPAKRPPAKKAPARKAPARKASARHAAARY
jgi:DNA-binding protein HU-beta